jgi:hypothetical protein
LLLSAVYEDCIRCEVSVVVDDVAEICTCFVALSGIWDEEFVIGVFI